MKITKLEGYSLSSPYGDGNVFGQPLGVKSIGIIEIHTNSGLIGTGETYAGVYTPELVSDIAGFLSSYVVGKDPLEHDVVNKVLEIPFVSGSGLIRSVISAIDIALWDIKGQALNEPIFKLLSNSPRERVSVYASGGSVSFSSDEIRSDIKDILAKGFDAYKMRIGARSWPEDKVRVRAARECIGGDKELMIDAIMGTLPIPWDLATAKERLRDLACFRPCWVEEPLHPEKYSDYKSLRHQAEVKIAMGESFSGMHEFEAYMDGGCVDIIQPDVTHCGGFTRAVKIIQHAEKRDIPVALHVWGSPLSILANLHLACAMPNVKWLEIPQVTLELLSDDTSEQFKVKDGCVSAPEEKGLGIGISEYSKQRYPFVPGSGYQVPSERL
jgi:L-alanine-DL-glutamate epimerase-like enolase superfamily enzyme